MRLLFLVLGFCGLYSVNQLSAQTATEWFDRANAAIGPETKITSLKKVLEADPNFKGAWCYLGYAYAANKDMKAADQAFDKEIAAHPDYYCAYFGKATLKLEEKKAQEAIPLLNKTIELSPNYSYAILSRSLAHEAAGNKELAAQDLETYQKSLQGTPVSPMSKFLFYIPMLVVGLALVFVSFLVFGRNPKIIRASKFQVSWLFLILILIYFGKGAGNGLFVLISIAIPFLAFELFIKKQFSRIFYAQNVSPEDLYFAIRDVLSENRIDFVEAPFGFKRKNEGDSILVSNKVLFHPVKFIEHSAIKYSGSDESFENILISQVKEKLKGKRTKVSVVAWIFLALVAAAFAFAAWQAKSILDFAGQ